MVTMCEVDDFHRKTLAHYVATAYMGLLAKLQEAQKPSMVQHFYNSTYYCCMYNFRYSVFIFRNPILLSQVE